MLRKSAPARKKVCGVNQVLRRVDDARSSAQGDSSSRTLKRRCSRDARGCGSPDCGLPLEWCASGRPFSRWRDSRGSTCWLSSSAMAAVAASRSDGSRTISVRPPLSSVMLRSAFTSTDSVQPWLHVRPCGGGRGIGRGCGGIGQPRRPPREGRKRDRPARVGIVDAAASAGQRRFRTRCRWRRAALRSRE